MITKLRASIDQTETGASTRSKTNFNQVCNWWKHKPVDVRIVPGGDGSFHVRITNTLKSASIDFPLQRWEEAIESIKNLLQPLPRTT